MTWRAEPKIQQIVPGVGSTERKLKMASDDGHGRRFGPYSSSGCPFGNNVLIENCIVDYEQGVSDVR